MCADVLRPEATDEICFSGHDQGGDLVVTMPELEAVVRVLENMRRTPAPLAFDITFDPAGNSYEWIAVLGMDSIGTGKTPLDAVVDLVSQL